MASEPQTNTTYLLEFQGVDKAFDGRVIYKGLDLAIRKGETLTILGGSGTGKSVCLKLIIRLLEADAGRVLFRGQDVAEFDGRGLQLLRTKVSMVFQGGALFDSMSVGDNVAYPLIEHRPSERQRHRERVLECLELVGLGASEFPGIADMMPSSLSGGMRKRVAIARSIALEPVAILYDEPTTGLDPRSSTHISRMIRKLQRELGVTSIVVTHDLPLAWHVADRVAMLHQHRFPFIADVDAFRRLETPVVRRFIRGESK